jgi:hypothetical protein
MEIAPSQILDRDGIQLWSPDGNRPSPLLDRDGIIVLPDGNMIDGSGAELAVELLGSQRLQIVYVVGPQVQHVVPAIQTIQSCGSGFSESGSGYGSRSSISSNSGSGSNPDPGF